MGPPGKELNAIACTMLIYRNTTWPLTAMPTGWWSEEYAPPKTVDAHKARQRLFDIIAATIAVLDMAPNKLVLKTRERQKGKNQYQKMAEKGDFIEVQEYNARLWVNLTDYLGYRSVPRPPYRPSHARPDE